MKIVANILGRLVITIKRKRFSKNCRRQSPMQRTTIQQLVPALHLNQAEMSLSQTQLPPGYTPQQRSY